jgi:hypothetical protein
MSAAVKGSFDRAQRNCISMHACVVQVAGCQALSSAINILERLEVCWRAKAKHVT